MRRWLLLLLLLVVLLALVVPATILGMVWLGRPQLDGTLVARGLEAPVELLRDRFGVADINAQNRADAMYALGFVHAQERFLGMDLARRQAAGELAALVGPAALASDRKLRPHRFRARAAAALARAQPAHRALLDRYVDGVNAGLAALPVRPWAYLLLRQPPREWLAEDCALVLLSMFVALDDPQGRRERGLGELATLLPAPLFEFIARRGTRWDAPLTGTAFPDPPLPGPEVLDLRDYDRALFFEPLAPPLGLAEGSNQFAVAGRLSDSGAALVANDMHLGLAVPNIWFRAQWRYPDASLPDGVRQVAGLTLPGVPGLIAGSNGQVAWGFTNAYGDWMDWVLLESDPARAGHYRHADGSAPIVTTRERLEVAGGEAEILEVRETGYGPVLASDHSGQPMALHWTAHEPGALNFESLDLETAADLGTALAVAHRAGIPPLNFVAGDLRGRIAWTITGAMPRRLCPRNADCSGGQPGHDWRLPIASTLLSDRVWDGLLPADQVPVLDDPPEGRLWTANARVAEGAALALIGHGAYDLGARAGQIRDGLRARERFDAEALLAIQLDDRALFLEPWRALLEQLLRADGAAGIGARAVLLQELQGWTGHAGIDSVAYRIVRAFRIEVHGRVMTALAAPLRRARPDFEWPPLTQTEGVVWQLLESRPAHLLDPRFVDWQALLLDCADRVAERLATGPGGLAARTWGEANTSVIRHPLSAALPAWLARRLDMPPRPLPGDAHMPRVQAPRFGASERFVVSPGHEATGLLHMPGGQSGHPLSPFHGAGHAEWERGESTPFLAGNPLHRLRLEPAAGDR